VIIPVIDIMNRQVVRGIGGRREEYRPIESRLTRSTAPVEVARALVERYAPPALYIADLDAIRGDRIDLRLYRELLSLNIPLWVDAGVRDRDDAIALAKLGIAGVICGTETLNGLDELDRIVEQLGERTIASLDLQNGELVRAGSRERPVEDTHSSESATGRLRDPARVAANAIVSGVCRLIVLDLAAVGEGRGIPTLPLCQQLADAYPHVAVITGGGVRSQADVDAALAAGVHGVLVASALHDGRIR